jgi:hypothetical protein
MKNGYKILWTLHALKELEKTIDNLKENWTEKELQAIALNLEKTVNLISINPFIPQPSDIKTPNLIQYHLPSSSFTFYFQHINAFV